jgi:hypothetical protein
VNAVTEIPVPYGREFLDRLNNYQILKKHSAPLDQSMIEMKGEYWHVYK